MTLTAAAPVRADDGPPAQIVSIDLGHTPFRVSRAVRAFAPAGAREGTLSVRLRGGLDDNPIKFGELLFDLRGTPAAERGWANRTAVSAEVRVAAAFVGKGKRNWHRAHRARLFLEDAQGRRLYLPNASIVDRPKASDGWIRLEGRPTVDVPMPLGFTDDGFDPARVTGVGVNVEAFTRPGEIAAGPIELRDLKIAFAGKPVVAQILPSSPAVLAGEATRAARMEERLRERCRLGDGGMAVGVNLAWPTAKAPTGEEMQLYGRLLDGGTPWWNRLWDLGDPAVADSVRADFREIRSTFGERAVVRLWTLGDLRSGIEWNDDGTPRAVTARARANMERLLAMALEERVVLIPVLLDFGLADGIARSGPDGAWEVSERVDLVIDPARRARLVQVVRDFVRPFAGHEAVLAWDVMNEPENAAGVVNPAHFVDMQTLVRDLVDAVHEAGGLATVGHRNVPDPARFFRGRAASDLAQVHYYPMLETRPNPTPFAVHLGPALGPLPGGWGELQARPGTIAAQLEAARGAGHRLFMFWSWRGHQETGDGFAVKPYGAEIRRALARLRAAHK